MKIQRALVPIDFSTCSMLLVREAAELAASAGGSLTLLHVAELPRGLDPQSRVVAEGVEQSAAEFVTRDAELRMAPYVAAARELGAVASASVRLGQVVPQILSAAQEADLVIMGTHGRTGVARALLGSVAEEVVRGARVPVMLVRRQPRPECAHASCSWCHEGAHSPAEDRVEAEMLG